jgi:soluble lytic murein transglycosylase-like protein
VIVDEMNKYDKPLLLIAISRLESGGFDPTALSGKGAYGLMQVRYSAHKEMLAKAGVIDPRDLYDIEPNIKAGHVIITQELKQANGDITKALEGYLGGQDGYYVKKVAVDLAELYCRVYKTK